MPDPLAELKALINMSDEDLIKAASENGFELSESEAMSLPEELQAVYKEAVELYK